MDIGGEESDPATVHVLAPPFARRLMTPASTAAKRSRQGIPEGAEERERSGYRRRLGRRSGRCYYLFGDGEQEARVCGLHRQRRGEAMAERPVARHYRVSLARERCLPEPQGGRFRVVLDYVIEGRAARRVPTMGIPRRNV